MTTAILPLTNVSLRGAAATMSGQPTPSSCPRCSTYHNHGQMPQAQRVTGCAARRRRLTCDAAVGYADTLCTVSDPRDPRGVPTSYPRGRLVHARAESTRLVPYRGHEVGKSYTLLLRRQGACRPAQWRAIRLVFYYAVHAARGVLHSLDVLEPPSMSASAMSCGRR